MSGHVLGRVGRINEVNNGRSAGAVDNAIVAAVSTYSGQNAAPLIAIGHTGAVPDLLTKDTFAGAVHFHKGLSDKNYAAGGIGDVFQDPVKHDRTFQE